MGNSRTVVLLAFVAGSMMVCGEGLAFQTQIKPTFPKELRSVIANGQRTSTPSSGYRGPQSRSKNRGATSVLTREKSHQKSELVTPRPASAPGQSGSHSVDQASQPIHRPSTDDSLENTEQWFGTVMTFPDNTNKTAQVVIHKPTATGPNEFAFIVENIGSVQSGPFTVEITTPKNVEIRQAFPFHATQKQHAVTLRFEGLEVSARSPIHIKTSPAKNGSFEFSTVIRTEDLSSFEVATTDEIEQEAIEEVDLPVEDSPFQFASDEKSQVTKVDRTNRVGTLLRNQDEMDLGISLENAEQKNDGASKPSSPQDSGNDYILTTSISGPRELQLEQMAAFEIQIANLSDRTAENVIVQLTLPPGMMISNLDRQAWIDQETRAITWKLERIGGNQSEIIRYQAQAIDTGEQLQKVSLGMDDVFQGYVSFQTMTQPKMRSSER